MRYLVNEMRKVNNIDIGINRWVCYWEKFGWMVFSFFEFVYRRKVEKCEFLCRILNKV